MWKYFFAVLAGVSLGIGYIVPELWFVSLGSFFLGAHILYKRASVKQSLINLTLFGFVAYGFSFYPTFWHSLPLDWLGIDGIVAIGLITLIWFITVAIFTVSFTTLLELTRHHLTGGWFDLWLIPSAYVLADTIGTFLFSLINIGDTSLIGPHFTTGSPGYLVAESPILVQSATVGGLYILLFIQASIGTTLYVVYKKGSEYRLLWYSLISLSTIVAFMPAQLETHSDNNHLKVAAITTYELLERERSSNNVERFENITQQIEILPPDIDIILLPEDSRYLRQQSYEQSLLLSSYFDGASVIDSDTINANPVLFPQINQWNTDTYQLATSSKQFLMVFGEYMPYLYNVIGRIIGQSDLLATLKDTRNYTTLDSNIFTHKGYLFTTLLCSDAMSPTLYAKEVRSGAQLITNLSSHGWFHQSKALYETAKRIGIVRAVENRRWYIRSANDTPSFTISPSGTVWSETTWGKETPLVADITPMNNLTLYTRLQLWILVIPFGIMMIACSTSYRRGRVRSDNKERG